MNWKPPIFVLDPPGSSVSRFRRDHTSETSKDFVHGIDLYVFISVKYIYVCMYNVYIYIYVYIYV